MFLKNCVLALCAVMLLTGCGSERDAVALPEWNDKREQVVLRFTSFMLGSQSKVYFDAIADFEAKHPNIRIETDYIQTVNYSAGVKMRLLGGEKMDVFDIWSPSLFEEFRKLDDDVYLDVSGSEFLDDFLPSSLEAVTIDGKVYGVPGVMHTDGLLYNKTMFQEMGLSVPDTWDEFLAACESLKGSGVIPIALNSEWWVPQFFFGSMMSNNGADAAWTAKLERGELRANDPVLVDAMKKTREIIDRGYVPEDWHTQKHEQSRDLIGQGKAAMIVTGTWDLLDVIARNPDQEIEFMMVPGEGRTVPNFNIGSYKVIRSTTEHPDEAKRFVAFMNGRMTQEKIASGALAVPSVRESNVDHPVVRKISEFVTREDATMYWPHTVSTESLQVEILEWMNEYLAGADLEKVLTRIQEAIDRARENA
jgi:raffinose/stachyose/melibiose transport system substrate-binding protein